MRSITNKIIIIKTIHSLIWLLMAAAVFYILYAGISGNICGIPLYLAVSVMMFEIIVLLINHWSCPLTIIAKKIKPDWKDGDDIYLPVWLAVNNKIIFGTLLVVGVGLVAFRLLLY
jgi:hypothetical protein